MGEKMFELKHRISESKLLALISAHAEEVSVDIYVPEKKTRQPRLGNSHPLLLEAPAAGQARGPYRKSNGKLSAADIILRYLKQHKDRVVANKELTAEADKEGVSPGAVSVAMSKLLREQSVERVAVGQYKILKEGIAKAAPKEAHAPPHPAPHPAPPKPRSDVKTPGVGKGNYVRTNAQQGGVGRALIWAELAKGEPIHSAPFRAKFRELGLSDGSVSTAFAVFVEKGFVKRIEEGIFQITEKGKQHHAAKS